MWDKRAEYLDNDSGSVKMVLDQGFGDTKLVDVRLLGIHAPELSTTNGKACQNFISEWFANNNSSGDRWGFIVTTTQRGRFDYVAVVTDLTSSSNLNAELAEFMYHYGYTVCEVEMEK